MQSVKVHTGEATSLFALTMPLNWLAVGGTQKESGPAQDSDQSESGVGHDTRKRVRPLQQFEASNKKYCSRQHVPLRSQAFGSSKTFEVTARFLLREIILQCTA